MELYFSPLACSMATRICLYEARATASYVQVDPNTKRTADGRDFTQLNPLGLVPTLRSDDGVLLTENAAILQYVADQLPQARLATRDGPQRVLLQQWLCFIGTELHKGIFSPLLDRKAPEGAKSYALASSGSRLALLQHHLHNRAFLLEEFSVADAYLVTVLGWAVVTPIDLTKWPAVQSYMTRIHERPSVARAFAEERALYAAAQVT